MPLRQASSLIKRTLMYLLIAHSQVQLKSIESITLCINVNDALFSVFYIPKDTKA